MHLSDEIPAIILNAVCEKIFLSNLMGNISKPL
jgi:hypothetical protein